MKPYPEDIIEEALQHGIDAACTRFNLPKNEVLPIVKEFTNEIDNMSLEKGNIRLCHCQLDRKKGKDSMCFTCTGPEPKSLRPEF